MNFVILSAICFLGFLITTQAQVQEASISQITSQAGNIPGATSAMSGGGGGNQAVMEMFMDPCTYKTLGHMAQVMASQQQSSSSGSGSSSPLSGLGGSGSGSSGSGPFSGLGGSG